MKSRFGQGRLALVQVKEKWWDTRNTFANLDEQSVILPKAHPFYLGRDTILRELPLRLLPKLRPVV